MKLLLSKDDLIDLSKNKNDWDIQFQDFKNNVCLMIQEFGKAEYEGTTIFKTIYPIRCTSGDVFSSEAFAEECDNHYFIDTDGFAKYANTNGETFGDYFYPSQFDKSKAPYVIWYNK